MRFGSNSQREHGRVGGIGLAVDRRRRQIRRQEALRGVDRRLDLFLRHVDAQREIELQHHHRGGAGAGGGHLAQALHLAELPFQRSCHRGGHHVRAGSGIERKHLNGRVVDLRQCGDRQLRVGDDPYEHDRGHQQRGRDRPQNKWARRTHGALLSAIRGKKLLLGDGDLGAVLQLLKAAVGDHISGIESLAPVSFLIQLTPGLMS